MTVPRRVTLALIAYRDAYKRRADLATRWIASRATASPREMHHLGAVKAAEQELTVRSDALGEILLSHPIEDWALDSDPERA